MSILNQTNYFVSLWKGVTRQIDYYNSSSSVTIAAGSVTVYGGVPCFAEADIPPLTTGALTYSDGVWKGNKASGAWTAGSDVFYNATGTPNVGTAASGSFTQTYSSGCIFVGVAVVTPNTTVAAATGDQFGYFIKSNSQATGMGSTVAATGSTNADAAALSPGVNLVTGANATKGVILPAASAGGVVFVKNADASNAVLYVYPSAGGAINALTATTGGLAMAAKTAAAFASADGTNWFSIPLLPS